MYASETAFESIFLVLLEHAKDMIDVAVRSTNFISSILFLLELGNLESMNFEFLKVTD